MNRDDPKWKGKAIVESSKKLCLGHRIPGPAGVLQEAMERRAAGEAVETMNTQEFLHRAIMVESEDTDFVNNSAWLTAVREGYLQCPDYKDLATIKNFTKYARVPLVVALVKSCVFNELREPMLELKDLTGSVRAMVHHKCHEEGVFPGILNTGSCLVLKQIVIWKPERTPYLNITLPNVERVIEKSMLD
ncbi:hypothetical protein Vadar_016317 [Vaccinium darrowii]|uniref:Uncharacterized protein n=1 Tax=Vaccinium darrowii TaxID=229202 RepID=A0ACB7YXT3_9ERIC|nr:hypothetical protein Vadar_016317 [Vaccinium darrowii]